MSEGAVVPETGVREGPARPRSVLDHLAIWFASLLGAGRSPFAPGTAGTLASIPLWWLLASRDSPELYVGTTLLLLALGVLAADRVGRLLGTTDPGLVVIDETVGFLVTMTFVSPSLGHAALGFFVFRLLDVLKPFGVRRLETMEGGFGVMMDDFMAGVYGNVAMRLLLAVAG